MPKPLLAINGVSKKYGLQVVLEDASAVISDAQKTAVIGRNGAGKSTLFKIILSHEELDQGSIEPFAGCRIGYVEQHTTFPDGETVISFLMRDSGKEEWECAKMAAQFQLKGEILSKPVTDLSGGYQMRVKLTAMLLHDPTLLLLDEPTNFLDLSTILLLERFLTTYRGSVLVISHDREFLKRTCTSTLEIERGKLIAYSGDIEAYLAYKEEQEEYKEKMNKKIKAQQEHLQTFVDRFRYKASKAAQAQSKLKALNRLKLITIEHALPTARINIPNVVTKPGTAVRVEKFAIGYPERTIARDITFEILRGQHVVIVGNNGQGKTTLLKSLAGELAPKEGKLAWWHDADVGYYAQHVSAALPLTLRVGDYLRSQALPGTKEQDLLRMAGDFLFRNDDINKPISVLSGGEKARLCLAGLLLHRHNVLLLDEPTNHLDFETSEALADALQEYDGTVIFVSHSRTFTSVVADRIIEVNEGRVKDYLHPYQDYVASLEEYLIEETSGTMPDAYKKAATNEEARERYLLLREKQKTAQRIEKTLADMDRRKSELLKFFFENPTDYAPEKSRELTDVTDAMIKEEERWMAVQAEIEQLKSS